MLGPSDAARLQESLGLLQRGAPARALPIATALAARHPREAPAQHLLALCRRAVGDLAGAAIAFETALALAPRDAAVLGNYGNLLTSLGRAPEAVPFYRRALAIAPTHADTWLNLGIAQTSFDPPAACVSLERATQLRPDAFNVCQALGAARRAAGDLAGAETALRRGVALNSTAAACWLALGVVRRLRGDPTEALECYERARRAGFDGPELDDAEAGAWLDLGDPGRAFERVRRLVRDVPAYRPAHAMLAHLVWEHGAELAPGEDPRASFRAVLAARPDDRALRYDYLRFLLDAQDGTEALDVARSLDAGGRDATLACAELRALELLGEHADAGRIFARDYPAFRSDAGFVSLYVRHLLRVGEPSASADRALEALEYAPLDQSLLAYLGVAWRMLGDPREAWLCDYERLVVEVDVNPPAAFGSREEFLDAVRTTLTALHTARREPVNQSLRHGSQTSGHLFGRRDPVIGALRDAIAAAIADGMQRQRTALPDDARHPFLSRRRSTVRFVGSWSVQLASSGRHVEHFHPQGWLSSAFYVALPPSVLASSGHADAAGCIQFGQPPQDLGLGLGPRRTVRPREGRLVLFPSYLWHGTVPFSDVAPRLTVAFDAVPEN
jgi:Tfp pilus assembly protein PilF